MILMIVLVAAETFFLIRHWRSSGFYPYPTGILLYLIGGQIALTLVAEGYLYYNFITVYSSYDFENRLNLFNLMIAGYFAVVYVTSLSQDVRKIDLVQEIRRLAVPLLNRIVFFGVLLVLLGHLVAFLLVVDTQKIWFNNQYLLMSNSGVLKRETALSMLTLQVTPLVALLSSLMFGYFYSNGLRTEYLFVGALFIFHVSYRLVAHSRLATMLLLVAAMVIFLNSQRRAMVFGLFGLAALSLPYVLAGRGGTAHGFSQLLSLPADLAEALRTSTGETLLNPFEGIFVSAEILAYDTTFPTIYKILSFSPLISAIDNFNSVKDIYIVKLHEFVPPSSILEVSHFGWAYMVVYFCTILMTGRYSVFLLSRQSSVVAYIANLLVFVVSYLQFTYPIRNIYRFEILAAILVVYGLVSHKRNQGNGVEARVKGLSNTQVNMTPAGASLTSPKLVIPRSRRMRDRAIIPRARR